MDENNTHSSATQVAAPKPKLERVAAGVLMAVAFLLPIFFIPSGLFSIPFAKTLVIYIGILVSLVLYILSILESGTFRLPANPVFYVAFFIPVIFLVSSLSSPLLSGSLLGYGFETGTFAYMLIMFLFLFLVSTVYSKRERIFYSYLLYLASFGIVVLFQLARLMFPGSLSFGVLQNTAANMVGSWNDLGVFFAVSTILALVTLETLPLNKMFRVILHVALAVSLVFLAIVNFSTLWYVLAAFSLVVFTYILLSGRKTQAAEGEPARAPERKFSYLSLVVLGISVLFVFGGSFIGEQISSVLGISNLEVRPSWQTTLEIAQRTLGENAVLGSGPNTFSYQWQKFKPEGINSTAFWSTDFSFGIGLIPTFLVTTGVLGIIAWLAFFGAYLCAGIKAIFSGTQEPLPRYLILSSFIVSVFLWTITVIYVPSASIIALTFLFTGLFLASIYNEHLLSFKTIALYHNSKTGFVSVLVLVFALILSVAGSYFVSRNFLSSMYFQKSLRAASTSDLDGAESNMVKAIGMKEHDIYYRSLSEIKVMRLNDLLVREGEPIESLRNQFQVMLGDAVASGLKAVEVNPVNYQNHIALGRIYESVAPPPFSIEGAYDKAKESYEKARSINPTNPDIGLLLARLEVGMSNFDASREHVNYALQLKPNYADAYFLLSQIEVATGNLPKAIASVESATFLAPQNPGVFFQLGLLKYNNKDYPGAAAAFEKAVSLVNDYANAKYFLGLSYDKLGRDADAVRQFEELKMTNADNKEIDVILGNLRAGRDPFAGIEPPLDSEPEKRDNPPVDQP